MTPKMSVIPLKERSRRKNPNRPPVVAAAIPQTPVMKTKTSQTETVSHPVRVRPATSLQGVNSGRLTLALSGSFSVAAGIFAELHEQCAELGVSRNRDLLRQAAEEVCTPMGEVRDVRCEAAWVKPEPQDVDRRLEQ